MLPKRKISDVSKATESVKAMKREENNPKLNEKVK
jgi:hypothetical protein